MFQTCPSQDGWGVEEEEEEEEDSTTVMVKGLKESTMEAEVSWVQTDERFGETSFCDFVRLLMATFGELN